MLLRLATATIVAALAVRASPVPEVREVDAPKIPGGGTVTTIMFPMAFNWWTLEANNTVSWYWAPLESHDIRVQLANTDGALLAAPQTVVARVPAQSFRCTTDAALTQAKAGNGYVLSLVDAANGTVYASSAEFEVKEASAGLDTVPAYRIDNGGSAGVGVGCSALVALVVLAASALVVQW